MMKKRAEGSAESMDDRGMAICEKQNLSLDSWRLHKVA